ncbi:MAG: radical SAM protein [Deltaproteobacteria bacterium]|nr:radical SAM protein [Deltaproteobacteria bacterium]MBW2072794.1 radical SAM protein [Deltaproteobacteria bacterium]
MVPFLEVFIGSRCNLECHQCPVAGQPPSESRQQIIDSMHRVAPPREGISFYGGEPLLRSDIAELVAAARSHGFPRIRIRTNGTMLADIALLQQLTERGCHHFEVMIYAAEPHVHDSLTRKSGSCRQSWAAMELLRQVAIAEDNEAPFLCVRISLRDANLHLLPDTIVHLVSIRPDRIVLSWDMTDAAYGQALPTIHNAINLALLNRTWVVTEKIPLCQMAGFEAHVGELYTLPRERSTLLEQCHRCVYSDCCPGVPPAYDRAPARQQFKPVTETVHLNDIRNLVQSMPTP